MEPPQQPQPWPATPHPAPMYPPLSPAPATTPLYPPGYRPPNFASPPPPTRRRGGLAWLVAGLFLTPVIACAALIGATAIAQPQLLARQGIFSVRISGTVYGDDAPQRELGRQVTTPVAGATVDCGSVRAVTDHQGRYSLSQLRGRDYTCSVTADQYSAANARIRPQLAGAYELDFGAPASAAAHDCASVSGGLRCGALTLQPGSISGVVLDSGSRKGINSAYVTCWDDSLAARASASNPARYTTVAGAQGQYTIQNAPVGPYLCVAADTETPQAAVARPGAIATLDLSICQSGCRGVSYHKGDVLHSVTLYLIFWSPRGARLDPYGSDARFRALTAQFVNDLGGSAFYGMLGQYWDYFGPARNIVRLGGAFMDTHPYPRAGTRAHPLSDGDIFNEIGRANETLHWPLVSGSSVVAVFTGYGIDTCAGSGSQRSCSFPQGNNGGFCAYHSYDSYSGYPVNSGSQSGSPSSFQLPYMLIASVPGCDSLPTFGEAPAPYGAPIVDAAIDSLSHELFEAVSDPTLQGWYESGYAGEIGDKCEMSFGVPARDGSTVRLAHGHGYALQREWSQASGACAYR
ncbi:MAG TPA: hypothetical protein VF808_19325 [Ktedonobacterales bacterium]